MKTIRVDEIKMNEIKMDEIQMDEIKIKTNLWFNRVLKAIALSAALLMANASFAAVNTNNPTAPTGTNSATNSRPSTTTGSPTLNNGTTNNSVSPQNSNSMTGATNPPLAVPSSLPMARPSQVDPLVPGTETTNEINNRSQRALRSVENCQDNDAACLRRREEQIRRNTPFNQQVPPSPGVVPPATSETIRQ